MKNFTFVICLAFAVVKGYSQSLDQKMQITANYDLVKLDELVQKFEKENKERLARIDKYIKNLSNEELAKLDLLALRDITDEGNPLFYRSHNRGSAITIRADKLRPGGSLGLNLTGNSMVAGLWEAEDGYPLNSHVDLAGRITVVDGGGGVNFHATHVAGTIMSSGGSTFDNIGRGIAYEANVLAANSNNDMSEMTTQAGTGLLVSNHSYGYGAEGLSLWIFGAYNSDASSLDVIAYNFPYYLAVVSAGNDRNNSTPVNPTKNGYDLLTGMSNAKNSITSAAVENVSVYNGPFSVNMSSFSNYGPSDDGRVKPDISSKGVQVSSTSNTSDTSYGNSSGTSMSAPSITGLLLLLQEHYNNVNSNFMLAATAKGILLHTADEAGVLQGPDYAFGWGLANGEKAAEAITNSGLSSFVEETTLTSSEQRIFNVRALGNEPLKVSISWTDPAAFPVSNTVDDRTPKLVNDLDILLTKDGVNYYPWKLDPINPTSPATRNSTNEVDNFEKVEVDTPNIDDIYEVIINHKGTLTGGAQNYSLVVTGGTIDNLSIQDNNLSNNLRIFPNPSKGEVTISFNASSNNDIDIDIYDLSGRVVYKNIFINTAQQFRQTLDLKGLQSGVYIVNISEGDIKISKKLIVE